MKKFGIRFAIYFGTIFLGNVMIAASKGGIRGAGAILVMLFACIIAEIITQAILQNGKEEKDKE